MEENNLSCEQNEEICENGGKPKKWKTGWRKEILDWIEAIVIAVIVALVLKTFVLTLAVVSGSSMESTLSNGDRLYVNKLFYTPEKGDIVIIDTDKHPQGPLVKRVIATEGDTVYIDPDTYEVYLNDELLDEDYIKGKTILREIGSEYASAKYSRENPIVIGKDEVFVMGDNRENSSDSRSMGIFTTDEVVGHAIFRFWPLRDSSKLD